MTLSQRFELFSDEFLHFERIEKKLSDRPDVHAFLMLREYPPIGKDIIDAATHDEIYLSIDTEQFELRVTDSEIRDLHRCGVRYDAHHETLALFV